MHKQTKANSMKFRMIVAGVAVSALLTTVSGCKPKEQELDITPTESPSPVVTQTPEPIVVTTPPPSTPPPSQTPTPVMVLPKIEPGIQGYISIPNTKVEYKVAMAKDNKFYLDRNLNGKSDYHGAIYFDFRNADPQRRRNIILYGHNMKDMTMFSTLHSFEKETFFEANKDIYFEMFGTNYLYEIVYAGMIDYREYYHIYTMFESEEAFLDYFKQGAKHAKFVRKGYEPQPGDEMLTLSTCVSHSIRDFDFKRMIVVARKVKELGQGEYSSPPSGELVPYTYSPTKENVSMPGE